VRHGEIGTEARERVIFIWEGAVATLPEAYTVRMLERFKGRLGLHDQALSYWKVSGRTVNIMWTLLARTFYRIDLCVTSRGPGFTQAVSKKILQENWPVEYVYCAQADDLGRTLAHAPDIKRIYYGLEEHRWSFGPNGYFVGPDTPFVVE
jgi:hypothetical protein